MQIRIGFNCCQFFDPQIGVPTFMHGEELWVNAKEAAELKLVDPRGTQRAGASVNSPHSVRLHVFTPADPPGNWRLIVTTANGSTELIVPLVADRVNATIANALSYSLADGALQIQGSLNAPSQHQGARILLKERRSQSESSTAQISFRYGSLAAMFSRNRDDPRRITIAPYAPALTSPNRTTVWAEVYQDLPLSQSLGGVPSIVFVPALVARTFRAPLTLTNSLQETSTIALPQVHSIDEQGTVPLRFGRITIVFFIEIEKIIHRLDAQFYVLPQGMGVVTASDSEAPPFASPIGFVVRHALSELSSYDLVLLLRLNGVDAIWNLTLIPPIARIEVRNQLTQSNLKDYTLLSETFSGALNIDGRTYALLRGNNPNARISLSVAGVRLENRDFEPNTLSLKPLDAVTVLVRVGEVTIRVNDRFGNPVPAGRLIVQRVNGASKDTVLTQSWASEDGAKLTLPVGSYEIIVEAEGASVTRALLVQSAEAKLEFTIPDLVSSGSQLVLALLLGGVVIVAVEVLFAARLWRRIRVGAAASRRQG